MPIDMVRAKYDENQVNQAVFQTCGYETCPVGPADERMVVAFYN